MPLEHCRDKTYVFDSCHGNAQLCHDTCLSKLCIRDWSLIMGRGATKRERGGGHVKFYPYKKGGGKSFSHAEGGAQQV